MKLTHALVALAFAVITITCAADTGPPKTTVHHPENASIESVLGIKKGALLIKTRSRLLKHGWQPIRMHSNGNYEYDGAEKRLVERGFMEVDSCSIDRGANCILYYRKDNACLRLDTIGEQVNWMKVSRWGVECPAITE